MTPLEPSISMPSSSSSSPLALSKRPFLALRLVISPLFFTSSPLTSISLTGVSFFWPKLTMARLARTS